MVSNKKKALGKFTSNAAQDFKVRRILKDINEARSYGIHINDISLNELYSYLRDARRQRQEFEREHPGKTFIYDPPRIATIRVGG